MNKFVIAVQFLIDPRDGFDAEGGYVNDPRDPGGETKYGIAKRSHPKEDIKNLTIEQAITIYNKEYWVAYNIEQYDSPYCIAVLDSYVQHKPAKVQGMLEIAKGELRLLLECRRQYYLKLIAANPTMAYAKKGWFNRLGQLNKYCTIHQTE